MRSNIAATSATTVRIGTFAPMLISRCLAGVLAALMSVALVSIAPAHARAPVADPLATTVTGACSGGQGRLSLVVHPPAAGSYRVEVTARGLAEGTRWTGQVGKESDAGGSRDKGFRRVAVDGGWTVEAQFTAAGDSDQGEVFFSVGTRERGDRRHHCFLLNLPSSPAAVGLAECNQRRSIALLARELDDGSTLVRSFLAPARADSKWHLTLTAVGTRSRQVVEFNDHADRRGFLTSRVNITGVKDPRLRLVATNANGRRCFIAVDPPNVTTQTPMTLKGLGRLSASRT